MRLAFAAVLFAALISVGYAQSPGGQPSAKKPSIAKISTERLDEYDLRGSSVRRKYWWYCWRRRGR